MLRKLQLVPALVAIALLLAPGSAAAAGTTRWVNDDASSYAPPGTSCNNAGYQTIQSAVDSSIAGDVINVCAGTYAEQVHVDTALRSNITLRSVSPLGAVIKAPTSIATDVINFKSIVRVNGAQNVTLEGFTITGPGPGGCDSIRYGVRVDSAGSATIRFNHITDIRDTPFSGCQNGVAIQVGRAADLTTGSATITFNAIDNYQKNGVTIDNVGSSAVIRGNSIRGVGATPVIAQNGIQVSRGAKAEVRQNAVSDNAYIVPPTLPEYTATGILLFAPGTTTVVEGNQLNRNQDGIGIYTSLNNRIAGNRVIGGIPAFSPAFGTMTLGDGIFADVDTAQNLIAGNFMRDNVQYDCEDDSVGPYNSPAMVANPWVNDDGITQNKPGLCRRSGDDEDGDGDHDRDGGHDRDGHHHESEED